MVAQMQTLKEETAQLAPQEPGMKIGEAAGDYPFVKPDGTQVYLGEFTGRPLLLIFLRHLA